jgi:predicted ATP-grasp superfamily ATP-dependent carboligase
MTHRVLVLDGNQRAALAATRSLGAKGIDVLVGESTHASLAGQSRHCCGTVSYVDPFDSPRRCFDEILALIHELKIQFILPITEATAYTLLRYQDELPESVKLPFPSIEQVEQLADKNALFRLAEKLEVPIPKSIYCSDRQEGLAALQNITKYPVVLKPSKSRLLLPEKILSTRVVVAYSSGEALRLLNTEAQFNYPFTIQSFIEGHGRGVFALYDKGQPVCFFAHRRLREKPPGGGVSVLSESAPIDEHLKALSHQLLSRAHWHGVAMVEFRVTSEGVPYLMEINPRFWGSLQLAIDAGVDFPYWLFCATMGLPFNTEGEPKHTRLRWLLGDLDRLYLVLKAPTRDYPFWQKLRETLRFLKPTLKTRHEVNRIGDLRPFFFELKQYLKALSGR